MIELVDPFFPAILAVGCITLLTGACGLWLGFEIGKERANKRAAIIRGWMRENHAKEILGAFNDGRRQGVREAAPKHDPATGRFTPKA